MSIFALLLLRVFTVFAEPLDWQGDQWKALLHFEGSKSNILSGFFLAPNGSVSLADEWQALERLKKENIAEASCRYPARALVYGWYQEDKNLEICRRWIHYRDSFAADQIELVLASAFINSPSSMYGHTLLKFRSSKKNEILDYTLNYGAETGSVVGLPYVWKGLTGGFSGYFAAAPFYLKIKEYNFVENRDFWIYPLQFSKQEVNILVAHSWELRDAIFPYYFLKKNCSYYLLDFLKVVRPGIPLTKPFLFWAVPLDTIRELKSYNLLGEARYRPSRYSKLKYKWNQLSKEELKDVREIEIANAPKYSDSASIAYEQYQYEIERKERERNTEYENYLMNHMKEERQNIFTVPEPADPLEGHNSSRLAFYYERNFLELNYRGTLHDFLSNSDAYEEGSELSMGDLYLRKKKEKIFLHRFDLLKLRSLSPTSFWSKKTSWYFLIGAAGDEEDSIRCSAWNCLQARLEGGYGLTAEFLHTKFFFLAETAFHYGSSLEKSHRFRLGPRIGFYRDLWNGAKWITEARQLFLLTGDDTTYREITGGISQTLIRNFEARVHFYYRNKSQLKFGLAYYF
ncbi:MAG: DUF4105 domain-containing protein [Oligoflexia bacterium]|nr:DUF4105 domain-containing protein [Oligoflexia bacterium]